jgi:hypothetical protein
MVDRLGHSGVDDYKVRPSATSEDVDRRSPADEVEEHLARYRSRVGTHTLRGIAVIAGSKNDGGVKRARVGRPSNRGDPDGERFELTEASSRLCLPVPRGTGGARDKGVDGGEGSA